MKTNNEQQQRKYDKYINKWNMINKSNETRQENNTKKINI